MWVKPEEILISSALWWVFQVANSHPQFYPPSCNLQMSHVYLIDHLSINEMPLILPYFKFQVNGKCQQVLCTSKKKGTWNKRTFQSSRRHSRFGIWHKTASLSYSTPDSLFGGFVYRSMFTDQRRHQQRLEMVGIKSSSCPGFFWKGRRHHCLCQMQDWSFVDSRDSNS